MTPKIAKLVTSIEVDEDGLYRMKGKTESDHNTIITKIKLDIKTENTQIKKWRINNVEGWKQFNEQMEIKYKKEKPKTQEEIQNMLLKTLKNTVGEMTINTTKKKEKRIRRNKRKKKNKK